MAVGIKSLLVFHLRLTKDTLPSNKGRSKYVPNTVKLSQYKSIPIEIIKRKWSVTAWATLHLYGFRLF